MVLTGLKGAFTPRGVHILSIFSLMPLTYGRHMIFGASSSLGGGGALHWRGWWRGSLVHHPQGGLHCLCQWRRVPVYDCQWGGVHCG